MVQFVLSKGCELEELNDVMTVTSSVDFLRD